MSGGSHGAQQSTVTNKTEIPPEIQAYQNWQNSQFQDIYNKGLGVYGAQAGAGAPQRTIAPLSYEENLGIQGVRQAQGSFEPYLARASNYAANAATPYGKKFTPTNVSTSTFPEAADKYMSPYVKGALDSAAAELDRRHAQDIAGIKANAAGSNAFGGDREALLEAESNRNNEQNISNLYATGLENAYDRAANQFQSDEARRVNTALASNQLGLAAFNTNSNQFNIERNRELASGQANAGLAALRPELAYNDANALFQAGGLQRGLAQAIYDNNVANQTNALSYPWQQLERLQGALTPQAFRIPTTSTQTGTVPGPSRLQTGIGLGLTGLGLGSAIGGSFGGGVTGSALGGVTMGSGFGPIGAGIGGLAGLALGAFL